MLYLSLAVSEFMLQVLLLLGLTVEPGIKSVDGYCHKLYDRPVPCRLQLQSYGVYYVTDEKVVYQFRPVWWGVYDMRINGEPHKTAHCSPDEDYLICTNTFSFIPDHETRNRSSIDTSNRIPSERGNLGQSS